MAPEALSARHVSVHARGIGKVSLCIHFSRESLPRVMYERMWEQVVTSASSAYRVRSRCAAAVPFLDPVKWLYTRIRVTPVMPSQAPSPLLWTTADSLKDRMHVDEKSRRIHHRRHRGAYVLAFSLLFRVVACFESDIALYYVFTRVFARRWKWNKHAR